MAREWRQNELNGLALAAGGFLLVCMSLGGYVIGSLIDRWLGSRPLGAVIGLLLGLGVGFWDLYRIALRVMAQQPPVPRREDAPPADEPPDDPERE